MISILTWFSPQFKYLWHHILTFVTTTSITTTTTLATFKLEYEDDYDYEYAHLEKFRSLNVMRVRSTENSYS